jgi:hypothetical protein
MCAALDIHLSCHQKVPSIDTVALYYDRARNTHYDSNTYYCICLLIVSFFCQGWCILNYWYNQQIVHLTENDVQPIGLFGYWPLFAKSKFVSGHTCGMPYFMAKVLSLVRGQCLARNSGNFLVCYHKCLLKTHNNYLDCRLKFDKEMKNTTITENSWTDTWLDTSEYDQSVFFSTCNGSSRDNIIHTSTFNAFRT